MWKKHDKNIQTEERTTVFWGGEKKRGSTVYRNKITYNPIFHCPFRGPRKGWTQFSVALEWDIGPHARNEEGEEE